MVDLLPDQGSMKKYFEEKGYQVVKSLVLYPLGRSPINIKTTEYTIVLAAMQSQALAYVILEYGKARAYTFNGSFEVLHSITEYKDYDNN